MVSDIIEAMKSRINVATLTIEIPNVFENLKGKDANFEMSTSNTLLTLNLGLDANTVTHMKTVIFVTPQIDMLRNKTETQKVDLLVERLVNNWLTYGKKEVK